MTDAGDNTAATTAALVRERGVAFGRASRAAGRCNCSEVGVRVVHVHAPASGALALQTVRRDGHPTVHSRAGALTDAA